MQKAIALFKTAIVKPEKINIKQILRDAGYAENTVEQSMNIMEGLRPHLDPVVQRMMTIRDKALDRMDATVERADFGDVARAADSLTKNIQLLSGRATQNIAINSEQRQRLDELMEN